MHTYTTVINSNIFSSYITLLFFSSIFCCSLLSAIDGEPKLRWKPVFRQGGLLKLVAFDDTFFLLLNFKHIEILKKVQYWGK